VLLSTVVFTLVFAASIAKNARVLLSGLNWMIMLVCMVMIFLEGFISFFSELGGLVCEPPAAVVAGVAAAPRPAAPQAPSMSAAVTERLKQLDALRAQGAISSEEYSQQRARILAQL